MIKFLSGIKLNWTVRGIIGLGFGFALLILVASSLISYNSTNKLLSEANGLSQSHKINGLLKDIVAGIAFAESCERSYLLTGKDEYISGCRLSVQDIKTRIGELRQLATEGSNQYRRLELIEPMIEARVSLMEEIIETRQKLGFPKALELVMGDSAKILVSSLRNIIGFMEREENKLLENGTIKAGIFSDRIKTILLFGNIITVVVLASSLFIIFIDFSQRTFFEQELIKAKELAENSVKVKEHFLANISHEIRTPMNAISGLTKILLRTGPTKKQKEYLDAIKTSTGLLLTIINDILDLSKAQAGKMDFEKAEFRLTALISSITELLHSRAEEKNLKLTANVEPNIPSVLVGDALRLNQIILNLVSNAIKFTEKGEIELNASLLEKSNREAKVKFTVRDTGIGIPEEIIPIIFNSFTQASTETTRKYGGTGLGLNIVKELVELQGGQINVKSKVGQGSEFSFTLSFPIGQNPDIKLEIPETTIEKNRLQGVKVLLVEDNVINQLVAQTVLREFGCLVDTAENGMMALEKISHNDYSLVLMDIQMPEMSGYEATQHIRTNMQGPERDLPIIAMTANAGKSDEEKCLQAGMDDFISKPFDEGDLFRKISYWCKKGRKNNPIADKPKNIRLDKLKQAGIGTKKAMAEIISLFIDNAPLSINKMKQYMENGNFPALKAEAHKLRPSLALLGNKKLEGLANQIEEFGRIENGLEQLKWPLEQLEKGCLTAISELRIELDHLTKFKIQ